MTETRPRPAGRQGVAAGAAIHPTFLRVGPWALSLVVAALFGLSFATSYAALHEQTSRIDTLIAEAERFIELSRERRAALITAVATGQIDARDRVCDGAA